MDRYIFIDHEGVERVLRAHSLDAAHAAAHRFVLGQSNSLAAAAVALRTVKRDYGLSASVQRLAAAAESMGDTPIGAHDDDRD